MFFRQVYDDTLAQAAYLIGCQRTGEAVVIDPERDIDRYLDLAARNNLRVTHVCETHIHADYLSGARQLAADTGAALHLSDEGAPDWRYAWANSAGANLLRDGDSFRVGGVELTALHTPGHTPEHLCFLVTDHGGGATEPMGVLSGDFVFVGDVGRPDLLETAAGQRGAAEASAAALHRSASRFAKLPDYLQLWPAHGAGSACGKALGSVPQSTVGYEKRFNPALRVVDDRAAFLGYVLEGQPEPPLYFARMKRDNRDGPALLDALPVPDRLDTHALAGLDTRAAAVLDLRPWPRFRDAHLRGSLWSPPDRNLPAIAGSYIDEGEPVVLVIDEALLDWGVRSLVRIGLDAVVGWATPDALEAALREHPNARAAIPEIDADELKRRMAGPRPSILDVRRAGEHAEAHIPGATNIAHTRLAERLHEAPRGDALVVHCLAGVRSAGACAYLARQGRACTNLAGGFTAWRAAGGTTE